uniref:DUF5641 domain-containing protein n=1 Tax=Trichogramma kaykai TaxID=54128 RepID=A0ABD2VW65_9HYME
MSTKEELLAEQQSLILKLTKALNNLKKTPSERKSETHFNNRRAVIVQHWTTFYENDRAINRLKNVANDDYIKNEWFAEAEEIYMDSVVLIDNAIEQLRRQAQQAQPLIPPTNESSSTIQAVSQQIQMPKIDLPKPLTELSYNPKDKLPLTPGHFLVGEPTTSIPEPNLINEKISPANRWDMISKLRDIFWKRWRKEYLQTLQKRVKWLRPQPNVLKDSIVLLSEEKVPPSQWPLGRVIETIKGKDNIVRVVKIKIGSKILTRPVVKLCLMPIPTPRASPDQ